MEQKLNRNQFKSQARLPKFAIPSYYDLYIKLDLVACTFSGNVNININIIEKTNFIVLNALELNVHEVLFTSSHNQVSIIFADDRKEWFSFDGFVVIFIMVFWVLALEGISSEWCYYGQRWWNTCLGLWWTACCWRRNFENHLLWEA